MNPEAMFTRVREEGLLAAGRPVVVLLSGGRDSTCLLDVAVRVTGASAVTALHVNYGIRESAGEDDRHCHELCASVGVALEVRRPRPPGSGNVQGWARAVRYREALELAGGGDVAAGHTKTDQVETILYRLASSPSRRALLGMRPREGSLVRPLLGFTREDTAAYCVERGLDWREDETNASAAYARNRIRAGLVPALRRVHPAAEDNVLAVARILRDEAEVLDELVGQVLGDGGRVSLAALRALPSALRRLVIQRLADEAAGGFAPGAASRAEEIAALSDRGTALLDVGNGLRAIAQYGELRFERLDAEPVSPEPVQLAIPGTVLVRRLRGPLRDSPSRRSPTGCSTAARSGRSCWSARGGRETGSRRSASAAPRVFRICSSSAASRAASGIAWRWSRRVARSSGWRASRCPSGSR